MRRLAVLAVVAVLATACTDESTERSGPPDGPAGEGVEVDVAACDDPADDSLERFSGELVVTDRFDDGHPRNLGVAIAPTEGAPLIDGREWIRFAPGPLSRALEPHVGEQVEVCGAVRSSYKLDRTIFLRSTTIDGATVVATESPAVAITDSLEGDVVVLSRHDDGHPDVLGIATAGSEPIPLVETNKSSELAPRIGSAVRVDGTLGDDGALTVASYSILEPNPLVGSGDGFRTSFLAGAVDEEGVLMGGTEVDTLAAFDGKVFAGTSYRKNTQDDTVDPEPPGAQVLVLDRPDGRWKVDLLVDDDVVGDDARIVYLDTVELAFGPDGSPLGEPAQFLAAVSGHGELYLRPPGDDVGWVATGLRDTVAAQAGGGERPTGRSVVAHTDAVTGASLLLAGVGVGRRGQGGGIYVGTYDPDHPQLVRWEAVPEHRIDAAERNPRPTGLTVLDGRAYATVGSDLLRRIDGPTGRWELIWRDQEPAGLDSLRRPTAIDGPDGAGSLLLGVEGPASRLVRVDPADGDAATVELRLPGTLPHTVYGLAGYNGPRVRHLADGEQVTLVGAYLTRPRTTPEPPPEPFELGDYQDMSDGVILVRRGDGAYGVNRVHDTTLEVHPPLQGVRAILARSPFPGEEDVLYFGGFDHNNHLFHNTGWIMKAHIDDVLDTGLDLP